MPSRPPGPGRFSTMTCEPTPSRSLCAEKREMESEPPPGANGTMMCTGFAGYFGCARAGAAATAASAARASARKCLNDCMVLLLGLVRESRPRKIRGIPYDVRNDWLSLVHLIITDVVRHSGGFRSLVPSAG